MRRSPAQALGKLDLIVYLTTTLNTGHAWGTAQRNDDPAGAAARRRAAADDAGVDVQLRPAERRRPRRAIQGPRSEVSVLAALGRGVLGDGGPVNWSDLESHQRIRALIADLIPGLEPLADIDRTRGEFHIAGRRLDTPRFPTDSGKARFHAVGAAGGAGAGETAAAADDGALRGAVQHGRLRRGRHLPRAGAPRRDPDQSGGHASAGD